MRRVYLPRVSPELSRAKTLCLHTQRIWRRPRGTPSMQRLKSARALSCPLKNLSFSPKSSRHQLNLKQRQPSLCLAGHLRDSRTYGFEFIPRSTTAFAFKRSSGERIEPRRMFTDGGSIPRLARWSNDLDPWGFAPAYLVHDWEFDVHHCGRSNKSFESVRDSMMEAVRTLMDMGLCPNSSIVFRMIYLGISSPFARKLWDAQAKDCPLPPDISENCKRFLPS